MKRVSKTNSKTNIAWLIYRSGCNIHLRSELKRFWDSVAIFFSSCGWEEGFLQSSWIFIAILWDFKEFSKGFFCCCCFSLCLSLSLSLSLFGFFNTSGDIFFVLLFLLCWRLLKGIFKDDPGFFEILKDRHEILESIRRGGGSPIFGSIYLHRAGICWEAFGEFLIQFLLSSSILKIRWDF